MSDRSGTAEKQWEGKMAESAPMDAVPLGNQEGLE